MANPFKIGALFSRPDKKPLCQPKVPTAHALDQKKADVPKQPEAIKEAEQKRLDAGKSKYKCCKCGYEFTLTPQNFKKIDCPWCGAVQPKV
jgi:hypothetical protein